MLITVLAIINYPDDLTPVAFLGVAYRGDAWDLSHLDAFAFRVDPDIGVEIDVVVIYSCHCFTRSIKRDGRAAHEIPPEEIFDDGRERRVLDIERYELSRAVLSDLVRRLPAQRIIVANDSQRNFLTWDVIAGGDVRTYGVFFDVERDKSRKRRLLLRIQSAYVLTDGLTRRQRQAKKVSWKALLKAAYEGRKIRP
jgi:hypothetical protein